MYRSIVTDESSPVPRGTSVRLNNEASIYIPSQYLPGTRRGDDGAIDYLMEPPNYHGNPVDKNGSLVTVNWGYDISNYIFDACGLFTQILYIDALDLGIRAEYIEVLITRKPS
jgi:hypothetical protein